MNPPNESALAAAREIEKKGWIGVDLDGTLAIYNGWVNEEHIGEPIPKMADRVKEWLSAGIDVRIVTARADGGEVAIAMGNPEGAKFRDVNRITTIIQDWTQEHFNTRLPVTNKKDYGMIELWDDRAIQVIPNTGETVGEHFAEQQAKIAELKKQIATDFMAGVVIDLEKERDLLAARLEDDNRNLGLVLQGKPTEANYRGIGNEVERAMRSLHEQIRVADVAYNFLHGQHKTATARLSEMEKALRKYGEHSPSCEHGITPDCKCTCGLEQLLNSTPSAALNRVEGKE